jgi:hypothetical protein
MRVLRHDSTSPLAKNLVNKRLSGHFFIVSHIYTFVPTSWNRFASVDLHFAPGIVTRSYDPI